jgi:WD40 repeat protein
VLALAFAPDGQTVASGGSDGDVHLHEAMSGRTLAALRGHKGGVAGLAYAPDGKRLAAVGGEELRVWDVARGAAAMIGGRQRGLRAVAYSPDGRLLVFGGAEGVVIWDLRRDRPVAPQQ